MFLLHLWLLFVAVIYQSLGQLDPSPPQVTVEQGHLTGVYYNTTQGRILYAFLGIPYATPPAHKNRFKEPQPGKPWFGTYSANVYGSPCIQYDHSTYQMRGEEDCLYLNVYTPKIPQSGVNPLLDVIVYIHGGAFMFGSGNGLHPDYIAKHGDIVLVTFNYRLGPFGFFTTGDETVPGNNGLKDQSLALKWVKKNIINFGGNPTSVTIMGMSAGGASVHYHYLTPLSEGTFQRGIALSGTVFPEWTLPKITLSNSALLATKLGCSMNTTKETVKCLKRRPASKIIHALQDFFTWRYCPFTTFGPVVEPANIPNAFLTTSPLQLLNDKKVPKIPLLSGTAESEGLYPAADFIPHDHLLKELDEKWADISPHLLHFSYISDPIERASISQQIRQFYFPDKPISKDTANVIVKMLGDRLFFVPIRQAVKMHAAASPESPVYCYRFNYRGKYGLSNKYAGNLENYGVSHGDDLQYVLKVYYGNAEETNDDIEMINFMAPMITSFAQWGTPIVKNVTWPSVATDMSTMQCLEITSSKTQSMKVYEDVEVDQFWKNILPLEDTTPMQPTVHQEL